MVTVFFSPLLSGFFGIPFLIEDIPFGMELFVLLGLRIELTRGELCDRFIRELVVGFLFLFSVEDLVMTSLDFLSSPPRDSRPALSSAAAM